MKALIRPATMDDVAGVAEVRVRTWQAAYAGLMPADFLESMSVERSTRTLTDRFANLGPTVALLVADRDGEIVGFVNCGPSLGADAPPDRGEIYAIYVAAARWSTGTGRALHEAALESLRANGFRTAVLWVLRTNKRACDFYTRAGWATDGTEREDEINGLTVDEIRYARSLT